MTSDASSHLPPPRPLRTAIVGFGLAGRVFHAPLVSADPGYSLDAVVTGDPSRAAAVGELYGDIVVPDVDALLERAGEFDVVVVASPNGTHAELAHRALDAGLHVVVDKPFALTADDARSVIVHAERVGRLVTVFQNRRWDGDFLTVQRLVASGELGEVRQFDSAFEVWKPALGVKKWKDGAVAERGGGILFDLGAHLIDQALTLFGAVGGGDAVHAELDLRRPGAVADDDSFVSLRHENGVRSRLWMSAVAPAPRPRFRVVGSEAVFTSWGLDAQERQLAEGRGVRDVGFGVQDADAAFGEIDRAGAGAGAGAGADSGEVVALEPGAYPEFYRRFADAVHGRGAVPVDARDSESVLRIIEEAHRQSRHGSSGP